MVNFLIQMLIFVFDLTSSFPNISALHFELIEHSSIPILLSLSQLLLLSISNIFISLASLSRVRLLSSLIPRFVILFLASSLEIGLLRSFHLCRRCLFTSKVLFLLAYPSSFSIFVQIFMRVLLIPLL
jgi:hypothetical protein